MKAESNSVSHRAAAASSSTSLRSSGAISASSHPAQKKTNSVQFSLLEHPNRHRPKESRVRFSSCTTDIVSVLCQRAVSQKIFRYSNPIENCADRRRHCRPALKYTAEMAKYLREAGNQFARALSLFGEWCTGVTSTNPNVRSDMYKQLVAQTRSTSPHLKHAAEAVLAQSINGMWLQLVDDFTIQRLNYTESNIVLYAPTFLSSRILTPLVGLRARHTCLQ